MDLVELIIEKTREGRLGWVRLRHETCDVYTGWLSGSDPVGRDAYRLVIRVSSDYGSLMVQRRSLYPLRKKENEFDDVFEEVTVLSKDLDEVNRVVGVIKVMEVIGPEERLRAFLESM